MTSWRACGEVSGSWGSLRDLLFLEFSPLPSSLHPMLPDSSRAYLPLPPHLVCSCHTPLWACVPFSSLLLWCVPNSASQLAVNFECGVMALSQLFPKITDIGSTALSGILGEHTAVQGLETVTWTPATLAPLATRNVRG